MDLTPLRRHDVSARPFALVSLETLPRWHRSKFIFLVAVSTLLVLGRVYLLASGALIRSTMDSGQASQDALPRTLAESLGTPLVQQPALVPTCGAQPPLPPPELPPVQYVRLLSLYVPGFVSFDGMAASARQITTTLSQETVERGRRLGRPHGDTTKTTANPPRAINTQLQPADIAASPGADRQPMSLNPGDAARAVFQLAWTPEQVHPRTLTRPQTMPALSQWRWWCSASTGQGCGRAGGRAVGFAAAADGDASA